MIAHISDRLNGNQARRAALHRRARDIADDIRRRKIEEKRARANEMLGRTRQGHRLMIQLNADYHRNAV
ncbi:hypothetical protein ACKC5O_00595 [Aeromonas schubertii]|uniref:hypothetical protein n=1 Tax=Aeromonas schubertii TaxID=652 RepID=UPI0038B43553